jgi:hypothetical protein
MTLDIATKYYTLVHPKTTDRLQPNAGAHLLPEAGAERSEA